MTPQAKPIVDRVKLANIHVGRRIRWRRKSVGLTPGRTAAEAGITCDDLCQIERGKWTASFQTLVKIGDVLGVKLGWFFKGLE